MIAGKLTGLEREPGARVDELWMALGRRSGKGRGASSLCCWYGFAMNYPELAPGERAEISCTAVTQFQAQRIMQYCIGLIQNAPTMSAMVERLSPSEIETSTGALILTEANSWRTGRGGSSPLCCVDESFAMRGQDSALSDEELLIAKRPSLATMGGMLACFASPLGKSGVGYETTMSHGDNHDSAILVVRQPTAMMNNSPQVAKMIAKAHERDPLSANSEWGNAETIEFRPDLASYVDRDIAAAAVMRNVYELPYNSDNEYAAFADSAGGTGGDSYTLAITFNDNGIITLAKLVEVRPIFQPAAVTAMLAEVCKSYHVSTVMSDKYAGGFPRITWEPSERSKSEIYYEFLPLLNSGKVRLLDDKRLFHQLISLEMRSGRGTGRPSIDHPPQQHDDCINSVAGAALLSDLAQSGGARWTAFGEAYEKNFAEVLGRWRIVNAPTSFIQATPMHPDIKFYGSLGFPIAETTGKVLTAIRKVVERWPDHRGRRFLSGLPMDEGRLHDAVSDVIRAMLDEQWEFQVQHAKEVGEPTDVLEHIRQVLERNTGVVACNDASIRKLNSNFEAFLNMLATGRRPFPPQLKPKPKIIIGEIR